MSRLPNRVSAVSSHAGGWGVSGRVCLSCHLHHFGESLAGLVDVFSSECRVDEEHQAGFAQFLSGGETLGGSPVGVVEGFF